MNLLGLLAGDRMVIDHRLGFGCRLGRALDCINRLPPVNNSYIISNFAVYSVKHDHVT